MCILFNNFLFLKYLPHIQNARKKNQIQKFAETENSTKEDNSSAVTIEADGPSEDFKDEESKVHLMHIHPKRLQY